MSCSFCSALAGAGTAGIPNPDELETQMYLPGQIPSVAPPSCIEDILTCLIVAPPALDPTMQYKRYFKPRVAKLNSKGPRNPEAPGESRSNPFFCRFNNVLAVCSATIGIASPLTGDGSADVNCMAGHCVGTAGCKGFTQ